jgi:hypothetical protein
MQMNLMSQHTNMILQKSQDPKKLTTQSHHWSISTEIYYLTYVHLQTLNKT